MPKSGEREAYFPLIEKKYGEKMSYWFKVMKDLEGKKYPDSCAHFIINPFHTIDDLQQLIYDLKEDVKNNPKILDI